MDPEASARDPSDLERMLIDESAEPRYLRISLLESITNNFSNDLVIGSGGFAVVYKGVLQNGTIAVKKLTRTLDFNERQFQGEIGSLMRVKHKNVVRFLGYCSDTQAKLFKINGKNVLAEERQRFLCFEYLPWSLDKYINEPFAGYDWGTCYQIIKGVCEGLHHLHQKKIVHLDLKPTNILLDRYMVPKIAGFHLSRCFDEDQTRAMTSSMIRSFGYMAPETYGGLITFKSDIYSLGSIIIEILTGNKGYPHIDSVLESWSIKFDTSPGDTQLEPVRVCTEIGIECTDFIPAKRPDTRQILVRLAEMESMYGVIKADLSTLTETNASSFVYEMVDEALVDGVLTMGIAGEPSQPQQICNVPGQPVKIGTEPYWGLQMACNATALDPLERMLTDEWAEPTKLQLSLLQSITNNFSDDMKIGIGGFAVVYKGLLQNGTVAVKKLFTQKLDMDETKFHQEVDCLMRVRHKNVVRFLGYCSETQGTVCKLGRKNVMAEERQRFLCFEFLTEGSLDKYISDASQGLDWRVRYQIIKGICEGLKYLHEENIVHLDLKPPNILLDRYKVPKIADFGLSRCFDEKQTRAMTLKVFGTEGYMAPEYYGGVITFKADIYSLGMIITEILTGQKGYRETEDVLQSWATRLGTSQGDVRLEPVRICAEIGIECSDGNPAKRPCIQCIIERLAELERAYGFVETESFA